MKSKYPKKSNEEVCKNSKDKVFVKNLLFLLIPFLTCLIVMFFLPENIRRDAGIKILASGVLAVGIKYIFPWVAKTKEAAIVPVVLVLIGMAIPSIMAISKPDFYDFAVISKTEQEDVNEDIKHDDDLIDETEEKDAMETVANDIDDGLFKQFYELSYVENGKVKLNPEASEHTKIQLIIDAIVRDIEQFTPDEIEYTYEELNAGKYGELTNVANNEEQAYRENKDHLNKQQKIESIDSYLQKRVEAYKIVNTSELARLIGHTYAELSQHQTVNDNIYSNCSAISYYFNYCCLSQPEAKSKMYYEIGVRFNRIAEIAQGIYLQEGSEEYKKLCIDSLYMSVAYYKLYKQSFVGDYKNNFYLARSYKLLSGYTVSIYDKSAYLEDALDILFALRNKVDSVSAESKISLFRTLYNTLVEYESIPAEYGNKYSKSYVLEQKEIVGRLIN